MQLDVTALVCSDTWPFSGSIATHGPDAGPATWRAAIDEATDRPLTDDLDGIRAWAEGFGAWGRDELDTYTAEQLNALVVQYVSGDVRTLQALCPGDGLGDINWTEAEELAEAGTVGGNLGRGWAYGDREAAAEEAGWVLYCGTWHHTELGTRDHVNAACDASGVLDAVPCNAVIFTAD